MGALFSGRSNVEIPETLTQVARQRTSRRSEFKAWVASIELVVPIQPSRSNDDEALPKGLAPMLDVIIADRAEREIRYDDNGGIRARGDASGRSFWSVRG